MAGGRQIVEQRAGDVRRGDPEDREDRAEARRRRRASGAPPASATGASARRHDGHRTDSWPRYAGTSGRTHGDRKLRRPAPRATAIVRSEASIGVASSRTSPRSRRRTARPRSPCRGPHSTTGICSKSSRSTAGSVSMSRSTSSGGTGRGARSARSAVHERRRLLAQVAAGRSARARGRGGESRPSPSAIVGGRGGPRPSSRPPQGRAIRACVPRAAVRSTPAPP